MSPPDQHSLGLQRIHDEIEAQLERLGASGSSISDRPAGTNPGDTLITVSANGRAAEALFTREEIGDSALGIDAAAAMKARDLADRCHR